MIKEEALPFPKEKYQKMVVYYLLKWGGYLRQQIHYNEKEYFGHILEEPIWANLDLSIHMPGIAAILLIEGHSIPSHWLEKLMEENWKLGDHIIARILWQKEMEQKGCAHPYLCNSVLLQMEYPLMVENYTPYEKWAAFLKEGGEILLYYFQKRILKEWKKQWEIWLKEEGFSTIWGGKQWRIFWRHFMEAIHYCGSFIHLSFILEFYSSFLVPFYSKEENLSKRDDFQDVLEEISRIIEEIRDFRDQLLDLHFLERSSEERFFLEKTWKYFQNPT
ncbi:MAG: hypothetical protein D6785_14820 [Planctomycetota bacterium]|nr:MAG: hypothetical protein D6785_14820 [Planctomycetota bacterium]